MRANGQVRFLKISAQLQRRVATVVAAIIGVWLIVTLGMLVNQLSVSIERMTLNQQQAKVETSMERVAKYRASIDDVAKDLERRQDVLDSLGDQYMNAEDAKVAPGVTSEADKTAGKIGAIIPEAAALAKVEARQISFAEHMTRVANIRSKRAAAAIREYGLNPETLAREALEGMGGPFVPFFGKNSKTVSDPRFAQLADSLQRMNSMELALKGMPTSMPAAVMLMSSGFGYRHDPFTGAGAMHAGLDFKGPVGTPILAAADGKVTFAGVHGGYGNCVEITHANGLVTRYAHLSGFNVRLGQSVERGVQIARMGSTGRSTGPHLHFEVRQDGVAVNPRKFLEANPDVLKIQNVGG